jgi:alkylation response protein AidB-like acyl-CoA dehydrogenase
MDFDFTPEQTMLRDLTREVLSRESAPQHVRRWMADPTGYDEGTWRTLAEMGLQGLSIPEENGGQGLGMIEQALVLEEMGRHAYPGPYFATAVLAAPALGPADQRAVADGRLKATLALVDDAPGWTEDAVRMPARRSGGDYLLSGTKRFVPFAHVADRLLVAARGDDGVVLVVVPRDAPGLRLLPNVQMDQTSKTSTLVLEEVRVPDDAVVGGWEVLERVLRRAAVAAAAEMLGAARRCLELSVEYARVRRQFDQPIGAFQAIKHACADMLLDVETAFAATYYAAWALDAEAPDAALAASVAKAYVGDAARRVCGSAIQVHGGIGFTWDYDLHLYVKRAKHLEPLYGDADFHRAQALQARLALTQAEGRQPVTA